MKVSIFSIWMMFSMSSCAHHKDVEPGIDGFHTVTVRSGSKRQQQAISQAKHFCEQRSKSAAFVKENEVKEKKSRSDMSEKIKAFGDSVADSILSDVEVYQRRFKCI